MERVLKHIDGDPDPDSEYDMIEVRHAKTDALLATCMIGDDHIEGPDSVDYEEEPEGYSFAGAEEIWLSSGMDEDYDFR